MKKNRKLLYSGIALAILAMLFMVGVIARPAFSTTSLLALVAPTSTPKPEQGDVIPLKSLDELTTLNATAKINVNGLINGKRAVGGLNVVLAMNDQGVSQATVTGPLLGEIAAEVGGSLVGLFTPKSVDLFKTPDGAYIVVNSVFPVCVKPKASGSTATFDEMSPQSLLSMLTSSEVARGKLVGQETYNGVAVKHYVINGDAFLAAAKNSNDPKLKAFGEALWSAKDADLYLDAKSGYPLAFVGGYSGSYEPLKFEGDFDVQIELTGINTNPSIKLPSACNKPITP